MENILHFAGQRRLSNKTKTLMAEATRSESTCVRENEEEVDSPLYKIHSGKK